MTQDDWLRIFIGDIAACKTTTGLRRWAQNYRDEIKQRCPEHVDELRKRYIERLNELNGGATNEQYKH